MFSKLLLAAVLLLSLNFSNVESIESVATNEPAIAAASFVLGQITGLVVYVDYRDSRNPFIFCQRYRGGFPFFVSFAIMLTSALSGHYLPGMAVLLGFPVGGAVAGFVDQGI